MKILGKIIVFCAIALALIGCPQFNGLISIPVEKITITNEKPISLNEGEKVTLNVSISPENADEGTDLSFTSSNSKIASVNDDGVITGRAAGTAVITVKSENGKTDTVSVTVKAVESGDNSGDVGNGGDNGSEEGGEPEEPAKNPAIALNATTQKLLEGQTAVLTVVYTDIDAENQKVTWSSSNTSVATVENGTVTAVKEGTATITATYNDTVKATCVVTVEAAQIEGTSEVFWNASDYEAGTYTTETKFGNVTLIASSKTAIDANSKTIDKIVFTQRLKLGGTGSTSSAALKFTTTGKSDITVYCASSSGSGEGRMLVLATADNVINNTNEAPLTAGKLVYSDVPAGTYYLYSSNNGINIYGIKIAYEGSSSSEPVEVIMPSGIALSESTLNFDLSNSETEKTLKATLSPTTITAGYDGITWSSSNESVATVKNGVVTVYKAGTATITATTVYGAVSASCAITVTGEIAKAIRVTDVPTGWASYTGTKDLAGGSVTSPTKYGGNGGSVVTVSTRSDLQNYAKKGNYVIYVDGMIDMTDGKIPSKASESTTALDSWIASKSSVATSLATWKTYYAAGNTDSANESGVYKTNRQTLSNAWSSLITINVESNTTIIGLTDESGVKGGCFKISGKSNIVMRNLIIQDSYDPFPQIEDGDGFNANYDAVEISNGSKYIWIDHCTFRDTISKTDSDFDTVTLSDGVEKKYQVFDGLCDIKQASDFITVSYCKFMDHDKTQLIGHDSNYTADTNHQTITLHNNYYLNCGQRLPMVRFATIHIYNNYYDTDGTGRKNSYCIGLRENNKVYAENNYFGNVTPVSNSQGSYYFTGNYGYDTTGSAAWKPSSYYTYIPLTAQEAKADVMENAGAGILSVIK